TGASGSREETGGAIRQDCRPLAHARRDDGAPGEHRLEEGQWQPLAPGRQNEYVRRREQAADVPPQPQQVQAPAYAACGGLVSERYLELAPPGDGSVQRGVSGNELSQGRNKVPVSLDGVEITDRQHQAVGGAEAELGAKPRGDAVRRTHAVGDDSDPMVREPEIGTE